MIHTFLKKKIKQRNTSRTEVESFYYQPFDSFISLLFVSLGTAYIVYSSVFSYIYLISKILDAIFYFLFVFLRNNGIGRRNKGSIFLKNTFQMKIYTTAIYNGP